MTVETKRTADSVPSLDLSDGRIVAYWRARVDHQTTISEHGCDPYSYRRFDVTDRYGAVLAEGISGSYYKVRDRSGSSHKRYPVRFFLSDGECNTIPNDIEGTPRLRRERFTLWHGTGYGDGVYLRAKRGKRAYHHNPSADNYQCCKCGRSYNTQYEIQHHLYVYCK